MRTTLNVDEQLLNKEQQLTGIGGKAALVRKGLRALIERESARRLAKLGATEPDMQKASAPQIWPLMILVDTYVWNDHLRSGSHLLATLLHDAAV